MISLPLEPKIIEKKDNRAIFEIEALCPGYGVTVGNSLRRVLFSSLPGAAVTQMKIKGALHEFSTIPGILEDTVTIMLNLKQLRFKLYSDEPQKIQLKIKEEREIKASDFSVPAQVEIVNKDAHIAVITNPKTELEIEIQVENGLGYIPAEQRKKSKLEVGVISLDAIFTPMKMVNFQVENMRVGERTDFDRLRLEIETDGTITPEEALSQASGILVKHFSFFCDTLNKKPAELAKKQSGKNKKTDNLKKTAGQQDTEKTKIEELGVSAKVANALVQNKIKTVGSLVKKTEEKLLSFEGIGDKGIKEIKKSLKKLDSELKE